MNDKSNHIINPFYTSLKEEISVPTNKIFSKFKRVLLLCNKNGNLFLNNEITQKLINKSTLETMKENFKLQVGSLSLMNNAIHRDRAKIIEKSILEYLNTEKILLENEEIVIPFFDIDGRKLNLYNQLYEANEHFEDITDLMMLYQYFNCKQATLCKKRLSNIINSIHDSDYWAIPNNCKINMTEAFKERTFNFKEPMRSSIKTIIAGKNLQVKDNEIIKIIENFTKYSKNTHYFQNNKNVYRKDAYVDASNAIKSKKQKYYKIDETTLLTKEHVNKIFDLIDEPKVLYDICNAFLLSKQNCHLVLNNENILDKMKDLIRKYLPLYSYIFKYPWLCMVIEEGITKTKTNKDNRYVFTINTANKLPFFPYTYQNITKNPYCTVGRAS